MQLVALFGRPPGERDGRGVRFQDLPRRDLDRTVNAQAHRFSEELSVRSGFGASFA